MSYLAFTSVLGLLAGFALASMFTVRNGKVELDERPTLPRWFVCIMLILILGGLFNVGVFSYSNDHCIAEMRDIVSYENAQLVHAATDEQRAVIFNMAREQLDQVCPE